METVKTCYTALQHISQAQLVCQLLICLFIGVQKPICKSILEKNISTDH